MRRRESVAGLNRRSDGVQISSRFFFPLNYAHYSDPAFVSATLPIGCETGLSRGSRRHRQV